MDEKDVKRQRMEAAAARMAKRNMRREVVEIPRTLSDEPEKRYAIYQIITASMTDGTEVRRTRVTSKPTEAEAQGNALSRNIKGEGDEIFVVVEEIAHGSGVDAR